MKVDLSEVNVIEVCAHSMRVILGRVPPGKKQWEREEIATFERVEDGEFNGGTLGLATYHVKFKEAP